ncbi:hypothetical protein C8Q79DRAFT_927265 [Trametes meyenii]|nr:hypothetical protein C8Q79DRAFT_927265 [Trametes meyenii]
MSLICAIPHDANTTYPSTSLPYHADGCAQGPTTAACPNSASASPAGAEHVEKPSQARQITQHPPVHSPYPATNNAQRAQIVAGPSDPQSATTAPSPASAEHVEKPSQARQITQHPPTCPPPAALAALRVAPGPSPAPDVDVNPESRFSQGSTDGTAAGGRGRTESITTSVLYDSPVALMRPHLPSRAAAVPPCERETQPGGVDGTTPAMPQEIPGGGLGLGALPRGSGDGGAILAPSEGVPGPVRDGPPLLLPAVDSSSDLGHWELANGHGDGPGTGSSGSGEPSLCGSSASGVPGGQPGGATVLPVETAVVVV